MCHYILRGSVSLAVSGYVVDTGFGVGGFTSGTTANDNVFTVGLVESGSPDTDATPSVSVIANTLLTEDGGTDALAATCQPIKMFAPFCRSRRATPVRIQGPDTLRTLLLPG